MSYLVVDGIASDVQRGTEIHGGGASIQGSGSMQISSNQVTILRIGKQAAELKSKAMFIVKDGDRVIAAGRGKRGVLKIGAARNISAGTGYHPPIVTSWIGAGMSLLLGVPLSIAIIGLPFVALGIYFAYTAWGYMKSVAMVEEAARNAQPLTA